MALCAIADQLGHNDVSRLLKKTLDEEGAADKKLTAISESEVLPAAIESDESEQDD